MEMKISIGFLVADEERGVGFTDFGSGLVSLGLIYPPRAWFTCLRHGLPI